MSGEKQGNGGGGGTAVIDDFDIDIDERFEEPPKYKCVLINDDFTPMEFVVNILRHIFRMNEQQAIKVMLQVHNAGKGVAGVYTREIAETKCAQVQQAAVEHGHPLQVAMEKE